MCTTDRGIRYGVRCSYASTKGVNTECRTDIESIDTGLNKDWHCDVAAVVRDEVVVCECIHYRARSTN